MIPPTSTPDEKEAFLAGCVYKTIPVRDVYEHLGLFGQTANVRKDPDFYKNEARELYGEIKQIAQSFVERHGNNPEHLQAELFKEETFFIEICKLERTYGQAIWGRADPNNTRSFREQDGSQDELNWDRNDDQETIRFYIRCWIVSLAVKNTSPTPRKGKGKSKTRMLNVSDGEHRDVVTPTKSSGSGNIRPSEALYRAPEPPNMCPPTENHHKDRITDIDMAVDIEVEIDPPSKHTLPTSPTKRKALHVQANNTTHKLQKVSRDARTVPVVSRLLQRNVYSIPRSPTLPLNAAPLSNLSKRLGNRGDTYETDRAYVPSQDSTTETETIVGGDEDAADAIDLLMHSPLTSEGGVQYGYYDRPTAGPSGTYQNPLRQDSVILPTQSDTVQASSELTETQTTLDRTIDNVLHEGVTVSDVRTATSSPRRWREQEDRRELFKLLLAYLNRINQFSPDVFDTDAEERMNALLSRLWAQDAENLRTELGNDFARLYTALKSWMNMRDRLIKFQSTTGYLGQPGEQWKSHLRRMPDFSVRAQACIAFGELKEPLNKDGEPQYVAETFDDDLATVFDLLTRIKGCNGAEEFEAVRVFNEKLLEWVTEE